MCFFFSFYHIGMQSSQRYVKKQNILLSKIKFNKQYSVHFSRKDVHFTTNRKFSHPHYFLPETKESLFLLPEKHQKNNRNLIFLIRKIFPFSGKAYLCTHNAFVVQWIEQRFPKPSIRVRFPAEVLCKANCPFALHFVKRKAFLATFIPFRQA